ncbi:MAG: DUF4097 family beta strand repeat protein [Clostridia bacterium]|nr:DUF4097 family beta strand repeat protein [Clostridia bacterium]
MSKAVKIWLIAAASLVILGCIIFGGVMTMLKWDFTKFSTVEYVSNSYELEDEITDICVITNTANVLFVPSENGKAQVECYEDEKYPHTVSVKDGRLTIQVRDERKWFEHIGISFGSPSVTIALPGEKYGELSIRITTGKATVPEAFSFESIDIKGSTGAVSVSANAENTVRIHLTTGSINAKGISAEDLELTTSTGSINAESISLTGDMSVKVTTGSAKLSGVSCSSFSSNGDTGDISLVSVIAKEKLSLVRTTGHVSFDGCDGGEISVKVTTGSVSGTLLSEKVFDARSSTGKVEVPSSGDGGKCTIVSSTGSIKIRIK